MNSNFQFLKKEFAKICKSAIKAEQFVITDSRTSLIYTRIAIKEALN
jgi:type I restriction enzyme R subunit